MRVAMMIPTLDRSGAEKQFTLLARGLKRRGEWEPHVIALTRSGPYQADLDAAGIPVHVIHKRGKVDPLAYFRMKRLLNELRPDLLHTWLFAANAYGRMAAGRNPGYPVVVSERCVDSWKSGWQLRLDRRLIARTSKLLANSESVANFYREIGYGDDQVAMIPNAVEIPAADPEARARWRAAWGIPAGGRVVGYVGRLARQKRLKDLIWGFQLFRQLTPDVYFVIVGDGPERNDLENYAVQMNCGHLIQFAGHCDAGAGLMSAFDQFWLGSEFEGMSNSLMEAMAAGVPCIVSDIPPNRELIESGVTGELFPVGDCVALAQLADRVLNLPEQHAKYASAGAARMRDYFGLEAMIDRHTDCYRALVQHASSSKAGR